MESIFNNNRLLTTALKWKFHFVLVAVVAALLAIIFSSPGFVKPLYRATARVYPMLDLRTYSEESESEQLLEFYNSSDLSRKMIETFDLGTVYDIPQNHPHFWSAAMAKYRKFVTIRKTDFEAVEIAVMDEDPQRANDMADSLITFCNQKMLENYRAKYSEYRAATEQQIERLIPQRDSLSIQLNNLRKKSELLDFPLQTRELTRGYMESIVKNGPNAPATRQIEKMLKQMGTAGSELSILVHALHRRTAEIDSLVVDKHTLERQLEIPYHFSRVVQKPFVPDEKAWPRRSVLVMLTVASALFLAFLLALFIDNRSPRS